MFKRPRGTRDLLPDEMDARRRVEALLRESFERYGYREVQTPTFEHLELITAKSGEEITDHLYSFKDKSDRKLTLRPELSAPTIRLYVTELRNRPKPRKLYYFENCFRYERTQKGRYREFWQAGVELVGSGRAEAEAEVVALAMECLENVGLKKYSLIIGNLGILRAILNHYEIPEEKQNHIFSMLDKKDLEGLQRFLDQESISQQAEKTLWNLLKRPQGSGRIGLTDLESGLNDETKEIIKSELEDFKEFLNLLEGFGVADYEIDFLIARGLDYYSGMVFEIFADGLGAQNQICGGGTFSLVKLMGGGDLPSCGFAFGFDRLMLALQSQNLLSKVSAVPKVFVVPESRKMLNRAIEIVSFLRKEVACDLEIMGRKLDKSLSYADSEGIPYVLIVSEKAEGDSVILKDMHSGKQKVIDIMEVSHAIG
jgi:histidyl-tRNA synthetase